MQIRRTAAAVILILVLFLQVGLRLPFLHVPLERDEGVYGYVAQRVLAGELPYRDAFDHKPPVIYYLYAGAIKLFGSSIEAVRLPTLAYSLLTTLALFYLGLLLFGPAGGLVAALLYAVFSGGPLIQGNTSNTETFMVLPLVLALACFLKKRIFWAGLLSGLAVMIKPVAGLNLLVLLLFLGLDWPALGRMVLGSVLPFLFFAAYFLFKGALGQFIYQAFLVNGMYFRSLMIGLVERAIYGSYATFMIAKLENSILWLLALGGMFYLLFRERSREYFILLAWAAASLAGVAASGLFFGHYYIQLVPALCLLAVPGFRVIFARANYLRWVIAALLIIILLGFVLPYQLPFYFRYGPEEASIHQYGKNTHVISYRLANQLKKQLKPTETIFVWPAYPEVYFYLQKKAPTRFFNYLAWMKSPARRTEIISAVLRSEPDYFIWTSYAFYYPEFARLLEQDYRPLMGIGKWRVFKKIDF